MKVSVVIQLEQPLYDEAQKCARDCALPLDRFLAEIVEATVASRRLEEKDAKKPLDGRPIW